MDGLPLAIELAAARVRTLSAEQLAERLSDRFGLLVGGARTALERQRTLRASVDWSHGLLERAASSECCGGWPCSRAASRSKPPRTGLRRDGRRSSKRSSISRSCWPTPHGREMRYRLLETVREYGLERLVEAGEEDALRGRHRDWFSTLALEAGPHLESPRQPVWLARLEPEAANLAAALDHALRTDPPDALRMCAVLYPFWRTRGVSPRPRWRRRGRSEPAASAARLARARLAHAGDPFDGPGRPAGGGRTGAGRTGAGGRGRRSARRGAGAVRDRQRAAVRAPGGRSAPSSARAAELALAVGEDWALLHANLDPAFGMTFQNNHARARRMCAAIEDVIERAGEPYDSAAALDVRRACGRSTTAASRRPTQAADRCYAARRRGCRSRSHGRG